jgi:hypothetical protein
VEEQTGGEGAVRKVTKGKTTEGEIRFYQQEPEPHRY